jgi:hypothetical protein
LIESLCERNEGSNVRCSRTIFLEGSLQSFKFLMCGITTSNVNGSCSRNMLSLYMSQGQRRKICRWRGADLRGERKDVQLVIENETGSAIPER